MHTANGPCADITAAFRDQLVQNVPCGAVTVPFPVFCVPCDSHLTDCELFETVHLFIVLFDQPFEIIPRCCPSRYIRAGLVERTDDAVLEKYQVAFRLDLHFQAGIFDCVHHNAPVGCLLTACQVEPDHFQNGLSPEDGTCKWMIQYNRNITGAVLVDLLRQCPLRDATVLHPRMVQVFPIQCNFVHSQNRPPLYSTETVPLPLKLIVCSPSMIRISGTVLRPFGIW